MHSLLVRVRSSLPGRCLPLIHGYLRPRLTMRYARYALVNAGLFLAAPSAYAAGTGMPWESPLQQVETSLTGPVAKILGVLAMSSFGLMFAFSEHGSALRKGMGIAIGLSIAFSANSFGATFFGFSGGAGF
jgi:type IV secretory pathway VirB2 component (pilin)